MESVLIKQLFSKSSMPPAIYSRQNKVSTYPPKKASKTCHLPGKIIRQKDIVKTRVKDKSKKNSIKFFEMLSKPFQPYISLELLRKPTGPITSEL